MAENIEKRDVEISLLVPVYNEEANLPELYRQLQDIFEKAGRKYELIFIDDGSRDRSLEILRKFQKDNPAVIIVELMRNFGQHAAAAAGLSLASGKYISVIDADLQNDPEDLLRMWNELDEGYDVVRGWRQDRKDPGWRKLASRIVNWMTGYMTGVYLKDYGCSLIALRRNVVDNLNVCSERSRHTSALISWMGGKVKVIPVKHRERKDSKSRYSFFRLLKMTTDIVTGFSTVPLQLMEIVGALTSLFGLLLGTVLFIKYFFFGAAATSTSIIIAVISFFFGIHFLALGIIGEYISRIFIEVQGRPYYMIKKVHECGSLAGDEREGS
jgi:undecaprenyl-phosphate 4-deoxy-4-formamido-L-arabinose transferase